ncbi:MAG TPA: HAMP domain-containing sensor histidine kinase [Thermoleophilaceae bacterium]|nr:HAMP domain-containing sensor histidine kinase [Thermoleophilaceae bacterium]
MSGAVLAAAGACLVAGLVATLELRRRLELVARAEHELRGPLAALSLSCATLARDPATRRHREALEAQLDRLRAGLSDLEEARAGRALRRRVQRQAPVGPGDASALVGAAVRPWRERLGGVRFEWRGGEVPVLVERGRFAQVIGNLVANAAEHGDGEVSVSGRTTGRGVRVEVRNRVAAGGAALAGRHGRGLSIATRAARELGGRLLVSLDGEEAVAVLELPALPAGSEGGPGGAEAA